MDLTGSCFKVHLPKHYLVCGNLEDKTVNWKTQSPIYIPQTLNDNSPRGLSLTNCWAAAQHPKQQIPLLQNPKWLHASRRTGRREVTWAQVMVGLESTGSTLEVVEMQEACTTTGSSSTNTILVTSVRLVCGTSTSSATSSTVPSSTSTSSGPWSPKMSKTRQPRILCPWLMSLSSVTSRYLARGFYLTSNPLLSRPSLFQRLLRRRLKRLVVLLYLQPRLCSFSRFWPFFKLKSLVILLDHFII